jgi:hypothetical protein
MSMSSSATRIVFIVDQTGLQKGSTPLLASTLPLALDTFNLMGGFERTVFVLRSAIPPAKLLSQHRVRNHFQAGDQSAELDTTWGSLCFLVASLC